MEDKLEKNIKKLFYILSENNKKEDIIDHYKNQQREYSLASSLPSNELAFNDTLMKFSFPAVKKSIDALTLIYTENDIAPIDYFSQKFKEYSFIVKKNDVIPHALKDTYIKFTTYGKK